MPSLFTFANNVSTTLAGAISSTATSLTLSSAANLPASIPAGYVLVITLNDQATRQQFEVIYATSITGATLSGLLRGQESTTAQAWSAGDYAYCAPTMGQMQAFGQLAAQNTWAQQQTFSVPPVIPNGTAANNPVALEQFQSSLATNGWKQYPDQNSPTGYFIEQWGSITIGTASSYSVALPMAFPHQFLWASASYGAIPPASGACGATPGSLSTILIGNSATSGVNTVFFEARGY